MNSGCYVFEFLPSFALCDELNSLFRGCGGGVGGAGGVAGRRMGGVDGQWATTVSLLLTMALA